MDLLLTKTPSEDIKNSVLPMVYRALEAPSTQIQVAMQWPVYILPDSNVWLLLWYMLEIITVNYLCLKRNVQKPGFKMILFAGAVPEYYPHLRQPDWLSVYEERTYPSYQIGLFTDFLSGCEFWFETLLRILTSFSRTQSWNFFALCGTGSPAPPPQSPLPLSCFLVNDFLTFYL